jgi:thioredoxin
VTPSVLSCFISYSHDSAEHRKWVLRLAVDLAAAGVEVHVDQDVKAGESLTHFMEASIRESSLVLVVCTTRYREKANGRLGGVGYETGIVTGELVDEASSSKFVPTLRSGSRRDSVPTYLKDRKAIDFRVEDRYGEALAELLERCGVPPPPAPMPEEEEVLVDPPAPRHDVPDMSTGSLRQVLAQEKPVVVEFWAPWCGPCRVLAPVIEELAAEYSRSTSFVRVNVDNEQEFAAEHEILSIPTIIVFDRARPTKKLIGAMPKRRLEQELSDHIGESNRDGDMTAVDSVALTWHEGRIKAALLSPDGTYSYVSADAKRHGLIYLPSFVTTGFTSAIEELEELLNSSYATKDDVRSFLEDHPDLILGHSYKTAHAQVLLRREGDRPLRPDFMLEPIGGELADVVEVEPAQRDIATETDGVTELTDVVVKACARLREYRDYFEDENRRVEIEDEHGLRAFRPRMFVVIGRSGRTDAITQRRLETQLPDVTLRSWDEVLDLARQRLDS